MRSPRRALAAATVGLEAFVVFFAGLVARGLGPSSGGDRALLVCSVLAAACLLVAGMLRTPAGYVLGSALQVAVLATGFWVPTMFFLGAVFAVLWFVALRTGARIERERAAFPASDPAP